MVCFPISVFSKSKSISNVFLFVSIGQKSSPISQASAGHNSNPSEVSTLTAYINSPPINSTLVIVLSRGFIYFCTSVIPSIDSLYSSPLTYSITASLDFSN